MHAKHALFSLTAATLMSVSLMAPLVAHAAPA